MTQEFDPAEGRRLWRQAQAARKARSEAGVSALELAAWLDGKADAALAARVERALAADEGLLATALAAREAASSAEPAPERLLVRARAMVGHPAAAPRRAGFLARFGAWQRSLEWAAVGACFLIAASSGFWIGGGLGDSIAQAGQASELALFGFEDDGGGLFDGEV